MKVIVTGATSFIGQAAVKELLRRGCQVTAVVRPDSPGLKAISRKPGVEVAALNLAEIRRLPRILGKSLREETGGAGTLSWLHLGWEGAGSANRSNPALQRKNIDYALDALETAAGQAPDFVFLQEVDADATRSYHVDEQQMAAEALGGDMAWVTAQNYDSPYLLWPLTCPHGASRSGIMTFSDCAVTGSVRRSLPVETGLTRYLDLDRCYTVTRVPVADGRELCLYNVHLSAYTSDGTVATEQVKLLAADMAAEYAAGNYAVCGGDFNKDLWEDSAAVFGVAGEGQTWAQPFPEELLSGGIRLEVPDAGAANPVPSCRNADGPYVPGESFVLTVDGFLVSENVTVEAASVVDTGFAWSDHNPVLLTFRLEP